MRGAYGPRTASSRGRGSALMLMPTPAAATEPIASVAITLTSMEPELPSRDGEITVTAASPTSPKSGSTGWRPSLAQPGPNPRARRVGAGAGIESNDPLGARYTGASESFHGRESLPRTQCLSRLPATSQGLRPRAVSHRWRLSDGRPRLQRGNNVAIGRTRVFVPVVAKKPRTRWRA